MTRSILTYRTLFSAVALLAFMTVWESAAQSDGGLVGTCEPSLGEAYLDANNVRARIPNNGMLFYRGEPHVYRVPRFSNSLAIFASSYVIGGIVNGELRAAGTSYGPSELWAGPLDDQGSPPSACSVFDRVYKVARQDVDDYEQMRYATRDLLEWPTGLGAPTLDVAGNRIEVSSLPYSERIHRVIDLEAEERPDIVGDLGLWWISNDRGNTHERTDTDPLGIEVRGFAYAIASSASAINDATFYRITVVNRSDDPIRKTYFGFPMDADLGDANDNYIGADTLRNMGFTYNSDDFDDGSRGYGRAPPALGVKILKGPLADDDGFDNDRNGSIDEPGERPGMSHFVYYNNGGGPNESPSTAEDYYNLMTGRWRYGNRVRYGGDGFETNVTERYANYTYPGDPVTREYWSELNVDREGNANNGGFRRYVLSSGPFDLMPGQEKSIDFAVVYGRGTDNLDSITELRHAADAIQVVFDAGFEGVPPGEAIGATARPLQPPNGVAGVSTELQLTWDSTPHAGAYSVMLAGTDRDEYFDAPEQHLDLSGLDSNALYFWRVKPVTAYGSGPWSEWSYFATGSVPPQGLAAVHPQDGVALYAGNTELRWGGVGGTFRLQIGTDDTFDEPLADVQLVGAELTFPTEPFKRYYWRVWTEVEGWSETWTFTTLETPGTEKNADPVVEFRAFPNPISSSTTIQFYLRESADVSLTISDGLGRTVSTPLEGFQSAGMRYVPFDTNGLSNGVYFCTLRVGGFSATKKLMVVR